MWISQSLIIYSFENNENINLYTHSEKIHKWDQGKCSEFQNQIDLRKIEELKRLLYEVVKNLYENRICKRKYVI
jgi:hypothetical protein